MVRALECALLLGGDVDCSGDITDAGGKQVRGPVGDALSGS